MGLLAEPRFGPDKRPSLALLIGLAAIGSAAMHVVLPSLPSIGRDLHADPATAQLTITLFLVGTAVGQLIYGPLSDRYGRRPVLLCGMLLFVLATLGCMMAETIGQLVAGRVVQSLGGCAGMVLGRAMVRDGTAAERAATALAYMSMVTVVAPGVAPALAGYIDEWLGWRHAFTMVAVAAAILTTIAFLFLPETYRDRPPPSGVTRLVGDYGRLMRLPVFVGYGFCGAIGTGGFFAMIASMPFLFHERLHEPTSRMGLYFALASSGFLVGSFIAARFSMRFGADRMLLAGNVTSLLAACTLLGLALADVFTVAAILVPFMAVTMANGISQPNAIANALGANPRMIGAASGLYGFLQMGVGALGTLLVSLLHDGTQYPAVISVLASSLAAAGFLLLGRRATRRARAV